MSEKALCQNSHVKKLQTRHYLIDLILSRKWGVAYCIPSFSHGMKLFIERVDVFFWRDVLIADTHSPI